MNLEAILEHYDAMFGKNSLLEIEEYLIKMIQEAVFRKSLLRHSVKKNCMKKKLNVLHMMKELTDFHIIIMIDIQMTYIFLEMFGIVI